MKMPKISNLDGAKSSLIPDNYNVRLVFLFTFSFYSSSSLWMGSVSSVYIYLLSDGSNKIVGLSAGIAGICVILSALPSGYLSDKFKSRDKFLRMASAIGVVSVVLTVWALITDSLVLVFVMLGAWGFFNGSNNSSLESIFADSVSSENRPRLFAQKHLLLQVASSFGPALNVVLFLVFGDQWKPAELKTVMLIGVILQLIPVIVLMLFNDKKSLAEEPQTIVMNQRKIQVIGPNKDDLKVCGMSSKWIPRILTVSDLVFSVGAGMTIKFFPIFFKNHYSMEPIPVNLLYVVTPLVTGIFSVLLQKASIKLGRAQMIFFSDSTAILCLLAMSFYPPAILAVPLFVMRGALMNCNQPIRRSILMDVVSKGSRGKWNSLEGISQLVWTGSAVVGGYLIDGYSFQLCFWVTACVYLTATLPTLLLIPLLGLTAKEKSAQELKALMQDYDDHIEDDDERIV